MGVVSCEILGAGLRACCLDVAQSIAPVRWGCAAPAESLPLFRKISHRFQLAQARGRDSFSGHLELGTSLVCPIQPLAVHSLRRDLS